MKKNLVSYACTGLLTLLLSGCTLFETVYNKSNNIEAGMTRAEVIRLLGKPDHRNFNEYAETLVYEKNTRFGRQYVYIDLKDDRVVRLYHQSSNSSSIEANCPSDPVFPVHQPQWQVQNGPNAIRTISKQNFELLYRRMKDASFDDKRLELFELSTQGYRLTDVACASLLRLFTWDKNRLKALQLVSKQLVTPIRIEMIQDVFTFLSSRQEVREIIRY